MSLFLLTLVSIIAYIGGLVIIVKITPRLLVHSIDEGAFVGFAAADVVGGILIFAAVAIPLAVFSSSAVAVFGARVLAFLLLVGVLIVGWRTSRHSFRARQGTFQLSRILAGSYCLLLFVAALCCMVLLFQSIR